MATFIVPAEDFWKMVPELGVMSRERAEEGTVRVTDEARTVWSRLMVNRNENNKKVRM